MVKWMIFTAKTTFKKLLQKISSTDFISFPHCIPGKTRPFFPMPQKSVLLIFCVFLPPGSVAALDTGGIFGIIEKKRKGDVTVNKQPYERYPETYIRLLQWIRDYAKTHEGDRLPPEEAIAKTLGVSRVKIRDVLAQLEAAGYITRKRGVGTLINRYVLAEAARLDVDSVYMDIVSAYGYRPHSATRKIKLLSEPPEQILRMLQMPPGAEVYLFEKVIYADRQPVIVVDDYLPAALYDQANCDLTMMDTDFYLFLQSMCDELLQTVTVHMDACCADEKLARTMQVEPGTALLKLDSVFYTQASEPILFSVEYYNAKLIPFSFQKRILSGKFKRDDPPSFMGEE